MNIDKVSPLDICECGHIADGHYWQVRYEYPVNVNLLPPEQIVEIIPKEIIDYGRCITCRCTQYQLDNMDYVKRVHEAKAQSKTS